MNKVISTKNAPEAIGCYSQAVRAGDFIYLSGQIGLKPDTMELVSGIDNQTRQVFQNLMEVIKAADCNLDNVVKITIYVTDMNNFPLINQLMSEYFKPPYPARATVGVKELPKGALVEADCILYIK